MAANSDIWPALTAAVQAAHARLDATIADWSAGYLAAGGELHCRRGCAGCCTLAVNCTAPEAVWLAAGLQAPQREALQEWLARLRRERPRITDLTDYLRSHRTTIGPCPFLGDDGACSVYARRPLACRALLATREPAWCGADFTTLPPQQKLAFLAGLDRDIVAFPMHYAAFPQEQAVELELQLLAGLSTQGALPLAGSLPWLVYLELEHGLAQLLRQKAQVTASLLAAQGLLDPLLTDVANGATPTLDLPGA